MREHPVEEEQRTVDVIINGNGFMKSVRRSLGAVLCTLLLFSMSPLQAEDIELFLQQPAAEADLPNVLIVIDNQSNWSQSEKYTAADGTEVSTTRQRMIYDAVKHVLLESPQLVDKVNVGIMNLVQATSGNPRGGRVISRVRPLNAERRAAGGELDQRVEGMLDNNDAWWKSSNSDYGMLMNEAYRYFAGMSPNSGTPNSGSYDASAINSTTKNYVSPTVDSGVCARNYVVFIATGHPQNDQFNNGKRALESLGGDSRIIPLVPSNYEESWPDEFARFMASARAQPEINTFVVDVVNPDARETQPHRGVRALWRSTASAGKGSYFVAWEKENIARALEDSFKEILSVNSVFAASSLPVSVNVRGTNLNQVYMGVFRPGRGTRWMGNLKLYQLAFDRATSQMYLADVNERRADSATTGFIHERAHSFWTHDSSFWSNLDMHEYRHPSDAPDGDIVEKGGAAQPLRNRWSTRSLLTCRKPMLIDLECAGTLSEFNATHTSLDDALVKWVKGEDNIDDEDRDGSFTGPRASIHGDVLHSRPAVLNYGNDDDIVMFYGSNDGHFRAVRGGMGVNGGQELWSFIAPEHFGQLDNLRKNQAIDSRTGKAYFMDGGVGTYYETDSAGALTKAWIYPTMRRGGRSIYAFNVTNYSSPSILWRRAHDSLGWSELGQTWSEPRVVRTLANDGNPVAIFGAGYDAAYEDYRGDETYPRPAQSQGRGIYVVDAATGSIVWQAGPAQGMTHSVPGAITVISRGVGNRASGVRDRAYFADTGGNVWRLDMNSANTADWRLHKLAQLGESDVERKFLFQPDVVFADGYDAILIGSGDREKPHKTDTRDGFFMIKDYHQSPAIASTIPTVTLADLYDATDNTIQDGATYSERSVATTALESAAGWVIWFDAGEKAIGLPLTSDGTVYFSTHEPQAADPESCSGSLGIARNYGLNYKNATATFEQDGQGGLGRGDRTMIVPGGGFVPSPVMVMVGMGEQQEIREAILRGVNVDAGGKVQLNRRFRTYWYTETDED